MAIFLGSMCAFVTSLNQSIMSVAFPDLRRSFPDVSDAQLSWVLNSYTIVAGATLILAAVVSSRFGRKRVLLTGLSIFTVAATACTLAPNPPTLIAARVVQAVGWAMITPSAIAVILADVPASRRATAIATWGGVGGVATALGPSVGAVLVDVGSWRYAFAVSIPFGLFVLIAGSRFFRESEAHELVRDRLPDPIGALALMSGVTLVIFALVQSPRWGWADARTAACLAAGMLLVAFLFWRSARVPVPMLNRRLLGYRNTRIAALLSVFYGTGFFATSLGLVLFLTQVWGYSVVRAGLLITPVAAMVTVLAPIAGNVADRFGHRVLTVPAGVAWCGGALWLLIGAGGSPDVARVWLPAMVLLGIGSGLGWPTIHGIPVIGIPQSEFGSAVATNQTVLRVAGAFGVAIAITLISGNTGASALTPFRHLFVLMAISGVFLAAIGAFIDTAPNRRPAI
ncbi:MAG TPA: MFS transporter [Acidimicrobiales bacterium]|nr:MFS transporter [Acidimicrobiales bacterium]